MIFIQTFEYQTECKKRNVIHFQINKIVLISKNNRKQLLPNQQKTTCSDRDYDEAKIHIVISFLILQVKLNIFCYSQLDSK